MEPNLASFANHQNDYHNHVHYDRCQSSSQLMRENVIIKRVSVFSSVNEENIDAFECDCKVKYQRSHGNTRAKSLDALVTRAFLLALVILQSTSDFRGQVSAQIAIPTTQATNITNPTTTIKNLEYNNASSSSISASSAELVEKLDLSTTTTLASISLNDNNEILNTNNNSSEDPSKVPRNVNFTQVDEIFNAVLSDSELVRKWRSMDTQIQESVKGILKMIFPQILAISQDAKVSGECSGAILKWILSLRNLRSWAIRMLDASGKPSSGIFQGSLSMLGNYKQCLAIRAPDEDEIEITDQFEEYFRGRYCVLQMRPWLPAMPAYYNLNATIEPLLRKSYKYYEKTLYDDLAEIASAFNFVNIRMDLCIPSSCNEADIQRVADLLGRKLEMRAKIMRCDTESREPWWNKVDSTIALWTLATGLLIAIPIIATLITFSLKIFLSPYFILDDTKFIGRSLSCLSLGAILSDRLGTIDSGESCSKRPIYAYNSSSDTNSNDKTYGGSRNLSVSESSFEIATADPLNHTKIQSINDYLEETKTSTSTTINRSDQSSKDNNDNTDDEKHHIKSYKLHLVRTILIIWFIVVQLSADLNYQYLRESLLLRDLLFTYWPLQLIINSTLLFESFILLTAFTYAYNCFGWSAYKILGYFVQKYLRITLSVIAIISFTIILPLINIESPIWSNLVDQQASLCKTNGFIDLLMLQNFIPYDKMCLPHTWVLCVEFQLALLSTPLLLLIGKTMSGILIQKSALIEDHLKITSTLAMNHSQSSWCILLLFVKSIGTLIGIQLIVFGFIMNFLIVYTNNLPPAWFSTFAEPKDKDFYFSFYLTKPWTHLSTFMIGLLAGCLSKCLVDEKERRLRILKQVHQQQLHLNPFKSTQPSPSPSCESSSERFSQRKQSNSTINASQNGSTMILTMSNAIQNLDVLSNDNPTNQVSGCNTNAYLSYIESIKSFICTTLPIIIMLAIIYSTFKWSTQELPGKFVAALYDSMARLLWSGCLSFMLIRWMTFSRFQMIDNNRQTAFGTLCIFLGRLSLIAFLISPLINNFILAVQEQAIFSSIFIIFHLIVGNTLIIYSLSFLVAILIEQPLARLVDYVTDLR